MKTGVSRQITLRLPEPLYDQMKRIAKRRRISINRLAQESLETLARENMVRELQAAYDILGTDPEEDAEGYLAAQSEVILSDE